MAHRDKFTVERTKDRTGVRHLVNRLTDVTRPCCSSQDVESNDQHPQVFHLFAFALLEICVLVLILTSPSDF